MPRAGSNPKQRNVIWSSKRADAAVSGIDQGEPQVAAIETKTGQNARDPAVAGQHIRSRRMGELVMFGVIDVMVAGGLCDGPDSIAIADQEGGCVGQRRIRADARCLHARGLR